MKHFLGYVETTAVAGEVVNVAGASGIAVGGYDPVAFFTDGKPTPGDPGVTSTYKGATYLFASKAHKAQFEANPEEYVPQFGGFCAYGAALGALPQSRDFSGVQQGPRGLHRQGREELAGTGEEIRQLNAS
jgi:YHS domain